MCCVANLPVSACLSLAIRYVLIYALYGACRCTQSYYPPPLSSCARCLQSCGRWTVTLDHNGDEHSRLFFRCFLLYLAMLRRCCCCTGVVSDARAASRCCAAFGAFSRTEKRTLLTNTLLHKLLCCRRLMIACCFKLPCCLWCIRREKYS